MNTGSVTVSAASNIALVKYWGKRDTTINDPATASLSIGLEDLRTETTVSRADDAQDNVTGLDEKSTTRLIRFFDLVRGKFDIAGGFTVATHNNFPTGSGLASSASGFAAVTLALNELLHLELAPSDLTRLARMGSGSAARSIFGGYVEVIASDDAYAQPVLPADDWPMDVIVAIISEKGKSIGSTEAMQRSADTSPYYKQWISTHTADMTAAKTAIAARDFGALAEVSEHNCLKMHAAIMTSRPAIQYWLPATVAVMHAVTALRADGIPAFFTIDAGSQVKVICEPEYTDQLRELIAEIPGVTRTVKTRVGGSPLITR